MLTWNGFSRFATERFNAERRFGCCTSSRVFVSACPRVDTAEPCRICCCLAAAAHENGLLQTDAGRADIDCMRLGSWLYTSGSATLWVDEEGVSRCNDGVRGTLRLRTIDEQYSLTVEDEVADHLRKPGLRVKVGTVASTVHEAIHRRLKVPPALVGDGGCRGMRRTPLAGSAWSSPSG